MERNEIMMCFLYCVHKEARDVAGVMSVKGPFGSSYKVLILARYRLMGYGATCGCEGDGWRDEVGAGGSVRDGQGA